jgi:hypothetical protein
VNLSRSLLRSHLLHRIVALLLVLPAAGAPAQDAALPAFKQVDSMEARVQVELIVEVA